MTEPLDEQIVTAVAAALAEITQANGYHHDLGPERVFTEQDGVGEEGVLDLIVFDRSLTFDEQNRDRTRGVLELLIDCALPLADVRTARRTARLLGADIRRALREQPEWPVGLLELTLTNQLTTARDPGAKHIHLNVNLSAKFAESHKR